MKKINLKKGDILTNGTVKVTVIDPNWSSNSLKVNFNEVNFLILKEWLSDWNLDNPIKDNRIISNKTFAIRLKNFIKDTVVNDACSADEQEYLLNVANRLLNYQISTATDKEEINYLKSLNLL